MIATEFADKENDKKAQNIIHELYPDREVIMLNVDTLGEAGEGIYYDTQQQLKL